MARLVFKSGSFAGRMVTVPLGKTVVLGRNRDVDLPLPDAKLSRRHCQLTATQEGCKLKDLGSTNGTFLNGSRLQPNQDIEVLEFDRIVVGDTEIELSIAERIDPMIPDSSAESVAAMVAAESPDRLSRPPTTTVIQGRPPSGLHSPATTVASTAVDKSATKMEPIQESLQELSRPLPPKPPRLASDSGNSPRDASIAFCDTCGSSIPALQFDLGLAREIDGKIWCKECLKKQQPSK